MRSRIRMKAIAFLSLAGVLATGSAQTLPWSDYFPLALGNCWTYRYTNFMEYNLLWQSDTGLASYSIEGRTPFPDSILWSVREVVDVIRTEWSAGGPTTSTPLRDSSLFILVEELQGAHRLYRQASDHIPDWRSVIPFPRDTTGGTAITRFREDMNRTIVLTIEYPGRYRYRCGFGKDSGLVSLGVENLIVWEGYYRAEHRLINGIVTEIKESPPSPPIPRAAFLAAFPNPFNPSTTIRYALTERSHIELKIFNVLGESVASLIDGEAEAGVHNVEFRAQHMSSGAYFVRLRAGDALEIRRLLYLK